MAPPPPIQKIRGLRQNIPGGFVLGRLGKGRGKPQLIPISPDSGIRVNPGNPNSSPNGGQTSPSVSLQAALDAISSTQGTILYRNATNWVALNPGTVGQVLTTGGAGANPAWAAPGGGGAFEIAAFIFGTPALLITIWQYRAARAFTLADDFAGSQARLVTAPGVGGAVFHVVHNASIFGTITFAAGSVDPVFATTGTTEVFAVGDRLSLFTIGALNGAADLAVTFFVS